MSEKTLLKEIEKEQQKEIEKKLISIKKESEKERQIYNQKENRKEIFSSASFPKEEVEKLRQKYKIEEKQVEQEINKIESKVSQVIEKPNYDYMETLSEKQRTKIFSIDKQDEKVSPEVKPKRSKFKMTILSILFSIFGIWGIVNIASIDNVASQIAQVSAQYEINLATYLKNLYTLDATNSENMKNLFEIIPEEQNAPNTLAVKSNWFDRICNFFEGLFGG